MLHPERTGFCDGLFGRPACSFWKTWKENQSYLKGYLKGQKEAKNLTVNEKGKIDAK